MDLVICAGGGGVDPHEETCFSALLQMLKCCSVSLLVTLGCYGSTDSNVGMFVGLPLWLKYLNSQKE